MALSTTSTAQWTKISFNYTATASGEWTTVNFPSIYCCECGSDDTFHCIDCGAYTCMQCGHQWGEK